MHKRNFKLVELLEIRALFSVGVADGGFETPALTSPNYEYRPAGTPWTFAGNAGVISGSSANVSVGFANTGAPEGKQVAFLQSPSSATQSTISQSIGGLVSGVSYTLSFEEESRNFAGGGNPFEVLVGGKVIVSSRSAKSNSSFDKVSVTFTATASGAQMLEFLGLAGKLDRLSGGDATDKTTFIDNVQLTAATGTISGTIFNDSNGNGKQDSGETGVAGVTVFLDLNKNGKLESGEPSTVTNASGVYSFANVSTGTYSVVEIALKGERATTAAVSVTVTTGATSAASFGVSQTTLISGSVFNDANGNKIKDTGEAGLAGVVVYIDTNDNGVLDFVDVKTTSNSSGNYSFVVPFGTYVLREVVPSGDTQTTAVAAVTLSAGETVTENIGDKK